MLGKYLYLLFQCTLAIYLNDSNSSTGKRYFISLLYIYIQNNTNIYNLSTFSVLLFTIIYITYFKVNILITK